VGEGEELADQLGGAVAFLDDNLQIGAGLGADLVVGDDQIEIAFDDGKGVVQFVGDAGDHLAKIGELLGLAQLLFEAAAVGHFAKEELEGILALVIHAGAFDLGEGGGAVFFQNAQGGLGTEAVDPFEAVALGLGRAVGSLTEGREELFPRFLAAETEQTDGALVQVKNTEIAGGGDDDGFAGLVKEVAVLPLGGSDGGEQLAGACFFGAEIAQGGVVGGADFLQDEDDHGDGDE
jgi:hypothetical protein